MLACMTRSASFLLPFTAALMLLAINHAEADQVLLTSAAPYWQVGPRDDTLSEACALGRFSPDPSIRLVARFIGKNSPATLTIGKGSGLGLYDPDRMARKSEDYFFLNAGTTSCEVFVGGRHSGQS